MSYYTMRSILLAHVALLAVLSLSALGCPIPPEDFGDYTILVYGRPACGFCSALRGELDRRDVEYTYYDIDVDDQARAEMFRRVLEQYPDIINVPLPVVDVNGVILLRPAWDEIREVLLATRP